MDNPQRRVVQGMKCFPIFLFIETPNVNSQEGTPSVRQSPYPASPSSQVAISYGRAELENSIPSSLYT